VYSRVMPSSVNFTPFDLSHMEEGELSWSIGSAFPSGTQRQWPRYRTLWVKDDVPYEMQVMGDTIPRSSITQ